MRTTTITTTLGALLLLALAPTGASAAPSCKGRDLVSGSLLKVVDRTYTRPNGRTGHRYVACHRGEEAQFTRRLRGSRTGARLEFPGTRGAKLVVRDPASGAVTVWDIAGKGRVRLRSAGRNPVGRVVVTEAGQAAALIRTASGRAVVGFDYDGTDYRLDSGAIGVTSLRARSFSSATWTKSGATRRADLSEPAVSCSRLAGRTVERSDDLNVVAFNFTGQFLSGELDGNITHFRACALPEGPVRFLGSSVGGSGVQGGAGFEVEDVAGTYVLETTSSADSSGDSTPLTYTVHDLATDRRVDIWGNPDAGGPNEALGDLIGKAVVTASGQAAAVFAGESGEQVVGFDAAGRPRVLDTAPSTTEIDEESLSVSGTILSWTFNGVRRTADLASP